MHMSSRTSSSGSNSSLSYKFQRLRERLRQAVLEGEFSTRLPGERVLAKRFDVNAKTINKAIGDLCAEGLLQRHIGRGTFVADRPDTPHRCGEFVCLTLPGAAGPMGASAPVANILGRQLASQGHHWQLRLVDHPMASGVIPLHAWPALQRHHTSGLLCCPTAPLSSMAGRFSAELIFEALRRQVPVVTLGAAAGEIRVAAVTPDYVDAGFRVSDHLYRAGCAAVTVLRGDVNTLEVSLVIGGCQAAAARQHRGISEMVVPFENRAPSLAGKLDLANRTANSVAPLSGGPGLGIVCVGAPAVRAALADPDVVRLREQGRVMVTAIVEPGNPVAELARLSSYDVEITHLATWAARLLVESRVGQRPMEILVPGMLRLRGGPGAANATRSSATDRVGLHAACGPISAGLQR